MPELEPENVEISVMCFRLADGTLIDPLTREPVGVPSVSVSTNRRGLEERDAAQLALTSTRIDASAPVDDVDTMSEIDDALSNVQLVPLNRRSLHDINLPRNQMAVICMAIMYKNWGLPDDEIALSIGITHEALDHVRNLDMYVRLDSDLVSSLRNSYMASVEGIMQQASMKAAYKMVQHISSSSADTSMAASRDVLDRSGHRPADKIEHTMRIEQDLVVRIIKERDEEKHFATLELDAFDA